MAEDKNRGFKRIDVKSGEDFSTSDLEVSEINNQNIENMRELNQEATEKQLGMEQVELGDRPVVDKEVPASDVEIKLPSEKIEGSEFPDVISEGKEGEGELGGVVSPVAPSQSQIQAEREKKIEKILEDGMVDIYLGLPPAKKTEFKERGEEVTTQINAMISAGKFKVKKVIDLIKSWLSIIPGVNKLFLEQEAKIKVDEIVKVNNIDLNK